MGFQGPIQNDLIADIACERLAVDLAEHIVRVDARNDHGQQRNVIGFGRDTNGAVRDAIEKLIEETGDDSWCMSDWKPA